MELLVLGSLWFAFLVIYPLAYILMRSEKIRPEEKGLIKRWLFNFNLSFKEPIKTVLIPIASSAALALVLHMFTHEYGLVTYNIPQFFLFSLFVFVVGEEIIYRGWIISGLLNFRNSWTLEGMLQNNKKGVGVVIIVLMSAFAFAMMHTERVTPFLYGLLIGGFFIWENKNIVPGIFVHLTANAMVALFYFGIL